MTGSLKQSVVRTKTLSSPTADGLDGAIAEFLKTLGEEQRIALHFHIADSGSGMVFAVLLEYVG